MSTADHTLDSRSSTFAVTRRAQLLALLFVAAVCAVAYSGYRLGLPGEFMFDDYPNLKTLSAKGGVDDLTTLKHYLADAFAGPTGRPIAMLSFLIDVRDWPAQAGPLKFKNVLIHLLNGVLLFWCLTAALRDSRAVRDGRQALWIGALAAAWWTLHPLHASTVLYVVQRMAELSTLFVLLGMVGYVYGRRRLESAPRQAYALMGAAVVLGTGLAALSKENGALLPLLLLVLEGTLFARRSVRPSPAFLAGFLVAPAVVVVAYLGWHTWTVPDHVWTQRGFTALERLMTEARILMDYLAHLLVPRPQTLGTFRDTIEVSTAPWAPWSTLPALLGIVALPAAGIALRRRLPLLSAAILFFFAGHLIESSVVPLELYFEHRNYLPSLLLFLPVAQLIVYMAGRVPKPAVAAGALITLILAATLSARADVWGDRTRLYLQWAADNPGSARAQLSAANVLQHEGQPEAAREILEEATRRVPDDLALRLQLLRLDTQQGRPISSERLERVEATAARAAFSIEALVALRRLTEEGLDTVPGGIDPARALALWQALGDNPRYTAAPDTIAVAEHYRGWIHAAAGREAQAIARFKSALAHSGAVEMGMMQAAILATHQHYCTAIDHLGRTEPRLSTDHHAARRQDYYRREIARIRRAMRRDAAEAGVRCETE